MSKPKYMVYHLPSGVLSFLVLSSGSSPARMRFIITRGTCKTHSRLGLLSDQQTLWAWGPGIVTQRESSGP